MINLYSDTQTLATPEMIDAMARAEVGDDVSGTDPTVNRLEALAAQRVAQPAAVFVPSGTMGNLISLMAIAGHGREILLRDESHIYYYEAGGLCSIAGFTPRLVPAPDGLLTPELLDQYLRPANIHYPQPAALAIENTHNRAGGTVTPVDLHCRLVDWAHCRSLHVHLDGARIFNAAIAAGVDVTAYTANVDSVMFCLSKGLSAPVGSIVAGSADFIARARLARKRVGGAMRQAGHLAAAGIVALEQMVDRLADDHRRARRLAQRLARIPALRVNLATVQTNMIYADVSPTGRSAADVADALEQRGLKVSAAPPTYIRLVTHRHITDADIETAADILADVLSRFSSARTGTP